MKISKKSLSSAILLALEKTVDGYVRLEDFSSKTYLYAQGYDRQLKKSRLSQEIKRLRERGLIEQNIAEDAILVKLTELGRDTLGPKEVNEQDWDRKYRIVIFDIPEDKRRIRDLFRRRLKHWGFKIWQQSVWVTKNNITDKLRKSVTELGLEKWVAILESDNIAPDHILFNGRGR